MFDDPTLRNGRENKETFSGFVLKNINGKKIEYPFEYGTVIARSYTESIAGLPTDYVIPEETISTSRRDINFVTGDQIRLEGGRLMTVKDISYVYNPFRQGNKTVKLNLHLIGGLPNDH